VIDARLVTADDLETIKAEIVAELTAQLRPLWLNEKDGAAYLGISPKALGNARRDRRVFGRQLTGGSNAPYVYAREELDRFARDG
jgi:hypothetical protein